MLKTHEGPVKFAILAADVAIFTLRDNKLFVRAIKVNCPPFFKNMHGLPGGLLLPEETAEEAVRRLIKEKAGIDASKLYLDQLYTFSKVRRDPRGRVVAVAYSALVPWDLLNDAERGDTRGACWMLVFPKQKLAYDHNEILAKAIKKLHTQVSCSTAISKLMPRTFTLTELENAHKHILRANLDKRNFRKKILKIGVLKPVIGKRTRGKSRPAQLYQFSSTKIKDIKVI